MATSYSNLGIRELEKVLSTDFSKGLKGEEASLRLAQNGPNDLGKAHRFSYFGAVYKELKNPLALVLIVAGLISLFLADFVDLAVIALALLINLLIGMVQEKRADDSFSKLASSQQKFATVLRDGSKRIINTKELVKGDVVYLEGGMVVPADIRILEENDLHIEESVLTGEWVAVSKDSNPIKPGLPISEQSSMAFMGTSVVSGSGVGIVVRTGKSTEVGRIAVSLLDIKIEKTPLEKNIKKISSLVLYFAILAATLIIVLGIAQGKSFIDVFKTAVAVAVSVVPEGLPAAVTVVLAIGMEKILKKGGLVKNLVAAETLGSTTVILTDKTGTITEGKMRLGNIYTLGHALSGVVDIEDREVVLRAAVLASDAFIEESGDRNTDFVINGRPVEKAIISAGLDAGIIQKELQSKGERRLDFLAFDSKRRYMASLNETRVWPNRVYFSGEPEKILNLSEKVFRQGEVFKMSGEWRRALTDMLKKYTSKGFRLTAVAYKEVPWKKIPLGEEILSDGVFLGFLAFTDPVRHDVSFSIETARQAGVKVIMLTGDHPETALDIAKHAGIVRGGGLVVTGADIEDMKDSELYALTNRASVFARVLPEQKLRISQVLRDYGEVVAMTGDGVNDAPALRSADIGIAVSSGTEVAKSASDMVLIDNSFEVITRAIEEGRRIMDNLRKIVGYLLSTSFGEVLLILFALAYSLPLPILPAQILWLNILGEGFMNFAFAFEDKEEGLMKRRPQKLDNGANRILSNEASKLIIISCLVLSVFLSSLYFLFLSLDLHIDEVRSLMFLAISVSALMFSLSWKNIGEPIWSSKLLDNKYFVLALSTSATGLVLSFTVPFLKKILSLVSIDGSHLFILVVFAAMNLLAIEILKVLFISRKRAVIGMVK